MIMILSLCTVFDVVSQVLTAIYLGGVMLCGLGLQREGVEEEVGTLFFRDMSRAELCEPCCDEDRGNTEFVGAEDICTDLIADHRHVAGLVFLRACS